MAETTAPEQYDWLAMFFLSGDSDVFEFSNNLLAEATSVGSTDRVAIMAERDPPDPIEPTFRGPILRGQWNSVNIGVKGGTPADMLDFVEDSKKKYSAKNRMLVLWDHGNGWQNVHVFEPVATAMEELRVKNLAEAIDASGIAVLCFDSCLMSMIEIAYELRDKVQYMVASENVIPADTGSPYDAILRALTMRPHITPAEAICAMVDAFGGSYNGNAQQPVTLSALNLNNVEPVVKAISGLATHLIDACNDGGREEVLIARRYTQSFGNPDYIDIVSFCDELQKQQMGAEIDLAAAKVKETMGALVIAAIRSTAASVSGANGVSIYFPDRPVAAMYQKLEFAKMKNCAWATFLERLTPPYVMPEVVELTQEAVSANEGVIPYPPKHYCDCEECGHQHLRAI